MSWHAPDMQKVQQTAMDGVSSFQSACRGMKNYFLGKDTNSYNRARRGGPTMNNTVGGARVGASSTKGRVHHGSTSTSTPVTSSNATSRTGPKQASAFNTASPAGSTPSKEKKGKLDGLDIRDRTVRTSNATAYYHRQEKWAASPNHEERQQNGLEKGRRDKFEPDDSIDWREREGIPEEQDVWEERSANVFPATKVEPLIRVLTPGEIEWGEGLLDQAPAMRDEDGDFADEFIICDTLN